MQTQQLPRLLITGASGYLGSNICSLASDHWNVRAHQRPRSGEEITHLHCDLDQTENIHTMLMATQPDVVIHSAAVADTNRCELEPLTSARVNVDASVEIARYCGQKNIPCLFISTDLVFDGEYAPYSEQDRANPINLYGQQKLRAEQAMANLCNGLTICRISSLYGSNMASPRIGFIGPIIRAIQNGQRIHAFTDEVRTPINVVSVASFLLKLAAWQFNPETRRVIPCLHLAGSSRLTRYEIALLISKLSNVDERNVVKALRSEVVTPARRPADVSLNISLARSIGWEPETFEQTLSSFINADVSIIDV